MVVQMLQHVIMMLMLHVITDLVFYQMGCTDSLACNYDPSANCDDGSCLTAYGCTDATACNYDANATCNNGSCILPDGLYRFFSM